MKRYFTLMEVMIAALVLTLSAVATLSVVGTSRANVLREERRWSREHYMANVVEFFLAAGPNGELPACLLPEGWHATCELYDLDDGLPEAALESIQEWRLGEFHIQLFDKEGNLVNEQFIRKLLKEEDLGYGTMGG